MTSSKTKTPSLTQFPSDNTMPQGRTGATYMRRSLNGEPTHIVSRQGSEPLVQSAASSQKVIHSSAANAKTTSSKHNLKIEDVVTIRQHKVMPMKPAVAIRPSSRPALPRQKHSKVLNRTSFGSKITRPSIKLKKIRGKPRTSFMLAGMAGVLFIFGVGISVNSWKTNKYSKAQVAGLSRNTTNHNDVPDEQDLPSDATSAHRVGPTLPRLINIPKLEIEARVQQVGVKANNELRAPASVHDAGWYEGSSKPGDNGTIVIDGHVSGPTKRGVFYSLGNLQTDDEIALERGDGRIFKYRVVKQELYDYDKVDMPAVLTSSEPGKPGLNLITCSGRFDVRTNTFEQRLVVFAVQAP